MDTVDQIELESRNEYPYLTPFPNPSLAIPKNIFPKTS